MEQEKKLYVGFDLCERYSQLSCYSYKYSEPKSVCQTKDEEHYMIPTVLFETQKKEWLCGDEAVKAKEDMQGVFIDKLLSKALNEEKTEVFGVQYDAIFLLEKFFRKTLILARRYFPNEPIARLCVTIEELNPKIHDIILAVLQKLGIESTRVSIISHSQAYLHYALSQPKELWLNDIGLFDFSEHGLCYYQININRRNTPMHAGVIRKDYSDILQYEMLNSQETNVRYIFENIVNEALHKQIVSAVYFNGVGFEGKWADEIMVKLCAGRRIFKGQNLYTKGACYAAKEGSKNTKQDIILYGEEMLTSNLLINAYYDAKVQSIILLKATTPWYEAKNEIEIILDQEDELRFEVQNDILRTSRRVSVKLQDLPDRPKRTTRLRIQLLPVNAKQVEIVVEDLGFGTLFPATHKKWNELIEI